ncbi:thioredoxin domain-containing protein 12-like [Pomacea canaliculata]|uniref:thioredoxin domain-containing protein 12-like n=1 Tax=Pomacea canaliculata TaxID=400727 RepID=UPI000D738380|nr:thioredoxin domain-containing protein 12-like [Pomacea canaliculata]AYH91776.1 thioredoxin domain-containing protein 12 [Pomacea canaliculata]
MAAVIAMLWMFFSFLCVDADNEYARGWGEDIEWVPLNKAWEKSKEESKVVMLVVHKTWCGACKALKPKFAESSEIKELSKNFIMVNAEDDEEPDGEQYKPDGGYIPRIMFYSPDGKLLDQYQNKKGNPNYKYYYPAAEAVVTSMRDVLDSFKMHSVKKEL